MRARPISADTITQGETAHFLVAYDDNVPNGANLAQSVLDNCENYYARLVQTFGGVEPPSGSGDGGVPFHVHIQTGTGGAMHGPGCNNTALHIDAFDGSEPTLMDYLVIAEMDEVFMADQGRSWDCGSSQGEALSRVLATELTGYSGITNGQYSFLAAENWLNSPGRPDYVSYNDPTDSNFVSIGCGTLFLNYMRHQLNIAMEEVVQVGGTELSSVCEAIMGDPYPFPPFALLMHIAYPPAVPVPVGSPPFDNPFPLGFSTTPLTGLVHLENIGDVAWQSDRFNGTQGQSRRLEGFALTIDPAVPNLGIQYMAHIENLNDVPWVANGQYVGTRDQGLRLEGFAIQLTGLAAASYTVMYTANVQDIGLTTFSADGEFCGTRGQSKRVEGMLVHVQPR